MVFPPTCSSLHRASVTPMPARSLPDQSLGLCKRRCPRIQAEIRCNARELAQRLYILGDLRPGTSGIRQVSALRRALVPWPVADLGGAAGHHVALLRANSW